MIPLLIVVALAVLNFFSINSLIFLLILSVLALVIIGKSTKGVTDE